MDKKIDNIVKKLEKILTENKDLMKVTGRSGVACVLVGKNGKAYYGMNVAWWNSNCAEAVALGNAFIDGVREFDFMVAVKLNKRNDKFEVLAPCGMCREMFKEFGVLNMKVVLKDEKGQYFTQTIAELLPF